MNSLRLDMCAECGRAVQKQIHKRRNKSLSQKDDTNKTDSADLM